MNIVDLCGGGLFYCYYFLCLAYAPHWQFIEEFCDWKLDWHVPEDL